MRCKKNITVSKVKKHITNNKLINYVVLGHHAGKMTHEQETSKKTKKIEEKIH